MVKHKLDIAFSSLSDPTRRDILQRLTLGELTVNEIASTYKMSLPAVSKHLKVLESARLITKERRGRQQFVKLSPIALQNVSEHLYYYEMLLDNRLDLLEAFVEERPVKPKPQVAGEEPPKNNAKQSLVLTHIFDAPVERVWEAYTDPQQIPKWWTAPGNPTLSVCKADLEVGGAWLFVLMGSSGQEFTFSGIFKEIEAPKRLVYTDGFDDPYESRPESLVTVTFEELSDGKTKLTKSSLAIPAVHQLQAAWHKWIEGKLRI